MHSKSQSGSLLDEDNPLLARQSVIDEATFDITAMIDLVFMMNIFFLVTTIGAAMAEIDLPTARHCVPADVSTSVIVTMIGGDDAPCVVYLGDGAAGDGLIDEADQEEAVRAAVAEGVQKGFDTVLIKAEKNVRLRDVRRISTAAKADGLSLRLGVTEKE